MVARVYFLVTPEFLKVISPAHFFIPSMVDYLLETVPMVVPFKDNENNLGLSGVVYPVTMYLTSILWNILESRKGLGGYHSSWTAFQFKLALGGGFFWSASFSIVQAVRGSTRCVCMQFQQCNKGEGLPWTGTCRQCQCGRVPHLLLTFG